MPERYKEGDVVFYEDKSGNPWIMEIGGCEIKRAHGDVLFHRYYYGKLIGLTIHSDNGKFVADHEHVTYVGTVREEKLKTLNSREVNLEMLLGMDR